ncbi:DUF6252 family protein [Hymenobacter sp. M29]|uniref:DUF6252 family protein n=1 Tax=Hymenobacter mellowenesis TaxID=3063995 RepID=A0ABT9AFU2_9BACT|nr:DUF6252 family protein [Hymenobacter sp. M29]MDO7848000.1 DUF6252 family protein [Hymenobacter sp. M29]
MRLFYFSLARVAAVLALSFFVACSSKRDDPAPVPVAFSGMAWKVDYVKTKALSARVQPSGNYLTISGVGSVGTSSMLLYVPNAVGTYALDGTSPAYASYSAAASNTQVFSCTSGTIVVSSISATNVTGSFAFKSANYTGDSRDVTEGVFNVNF